MKVLVENKQKQLVPKQTDLYKTRFVYFPKVYNLAHSEIICNNWYSLEFTNLENIKIRPSDLVIYVLIEIKSHTSVDCILFLIYSKLKKQIYS